MKKKKLAKLFKAVGCSICHQKPPYCETCQMARYIEKNIEAMRKAAAEKYAPKPKP